MARNDTDMERILREHFAAEAADLRAPDGLWERLEGRLGEQDPPSRLAALRGGMGAWAAAAAAVAVIGIAAGAAFWAVGGGGSGGTVPAAPATRADAASASTAEPASATAATAATPVPEAAATAVATPAPTVAPTAAATPAPTAAATPAPTAAPTAAATAAPTAAPTAAASADDADAMPEEAVTSGDSAGDAAEPPDSNAWASPAEPPPPGTGPGVPESDGDSDAPPSPGRPADTTFRDYGRQPFVEAAIDPVSTFSLDVDRTSYELALTWARAGYGVEPDSVRAEEWVNAFDYGYARPDGDAAFAITSELAAHPLDARGRLARIAFQAPDARDDAPLNVTLVLDASGSMQWENRVAIARAAAEAIRGSLGARDRIAVVHFTTDVLHDLTVGHAAPSDGAVRRSIARLEPHDSTNVQAGLDLGVRLADRARRERPDAHNYVILMSDGVANVDATDPFAILERAGDGDGDGNPLRLIAVGVGIHNYNDYLLEQLAQHGNGWYRYLNGEEQARRAFSRANWLALSTPFADQTRAQVRWDPAVVKAWRILGYENRVAPDHAFEQNRAEFAEIPSGAATTVFYELELREGAAAETRLGEVELRWVDPRGGERSQRADVTGRAGAAFAEADARLRLGAIAALAADRYAGLAGDAGTGLDPAAVRDGLARLRAELDALEPALGGLDAWRDLAFLLGSLAESAGALASPGASGYSR